MKAFSAWIFLALLGCGATTPDASLDSFEPNQRPPTPGSSDGPRPPNLLFVIADDFGVDVSPCYGNTSPRMPNLLSLCAEGLVFEKAWVNPICSPTRATLLTGRYGARTTVGSQIQGNQTPALPLDEATLAQLLRAHPSHPYATGAFGKWHLSNASNGGADHPQTAGFDHFSGLLQGGLQDYGRWQRTVNGETQMIDQYATSVAVDDTLRWLDGLGDEPWFVWLAFTAPHSPWHLPPADLHHQEGLTGEADHIQANRRAYYTAAAEALDTEMGRVLDRVRATDQPTVIIFLGDNGTPNQVLPESTPRARGKTTLFEGGIHVPLVIAGEGLAVAARIQHPINGVDLFTTALDLAGVEPPSDRSIDGLSLARYLTDPLAPPTRDWVYSEIFGPNINQEKTGQTLRGPRFKWLGYQDGRTFFFDLENDPSEQVNLLETGMTTEAEAAQATFEQALHSLGGRR